MQEQNVKMPELHPNDRRTGAMIVPHCPCCNGKRKVDSTYRTPGDPIVICYVWCETCRIRTPHELDDRDAVVLKPV